MLTRILKLVAIGVLLIYGHIGLTNIKVMNELNKDLKQETEETE